MILTNLKTFKIEVFWEYKNNYKWFIKLYGDDNIKYGNQKT